MNKRELSQKISEDLNIRKFEAYQFIDLIIESIVDKLSKNKKIVISNFGTFKVIQREAKRVINPNNNKAMTIPAKRIVKFIPSKNLKNFISGETDG